jgi:hypothetical protein
MKWDILVGLIDILQLVITKLPVKKIQRNVLVLSLSSILLLTITAEMPDTFLLEVFVKPFFGWHNDS